MSRGYIGAAALILVGGVACGSPTCPTAPQPGLILEVRDSTTLEAAATGAVGTARDGDYVEVLEGFGTYLSGARDRAGTYSVTVVKAAYLDWRRDSIVVRPASCGVDPVTVLVLLQPL